MKIKRLFLIIIFWDFALFGAFNFTVFNDQETTCIANNTSQKITVTIETTDFGKKVILGSIELDPKRKMTLPETNTVLFFRINNASPEAIFPKTAIIVDEPE